MAAAYHSLRSKFTPPFFADIFRYSTSFSLQKIKGFLKLFDLPCICLEVQYFTPQTDLLTASKKELLFWVFCIFVYPKFSQQLLQRFKRNILHCNFSTGFKLKTRIVPCILSLQRHIKKYIYLISNCMSDMSYGENQDSFIRVVTYKQ